MKFSWTAPDATVFPCEQWLPESPIRALIVCVHGLGGSAMDFAPLTREAATRGCASYALNLRGQGLDPSPLSRGHSLHLPELGRDIAAFVREARTIAPAAPLFLCGESMGALIVAWMLAEGFLNDQTLSGVILSVPVVALLKPTPPPVRMALRGLAALAPRLRLKHSWFVSGKKAPLKITRDEEYQRSLSGMPHYIAAFSFHFLNALGNLMESSATLAPKITAPCLVLAAGRDIYIRPEQIRAWFELVGAEDKTLNVYPEAYHVLWHDWDKDVVVRETLEWLDQHIPLSVSPG